MFKEHQTSGALIGLMRGSRWTMRGIASMVILTFGSLVTAPAVAAVKQEIKEIRQQKAEEGPGSRFSADMKAVKEHLAATLKTPKGVSLMDMKRQLNTDAVVLAASDKEMLDGFASVRTMIKDKHLPDVIMQRELTAEKHYNAEMSALKQGLNSITTENDDAKAQARSKDVLDRLSQFQDERKAQKFDPKNMPNRSLKPDLSRVPHTTKKSFAEAGFVSNPRLMVATTASNFDFSQLPGASDPAYLAATTEVTLSPAIQAQAAALHNNPVEIYNWVRNNVQWQPTWGAVQDADLTLSAQRGNAFDISSLLIALLRASGVPARYVHGTIIVPEAKFRNWVGGFQDINAAVNYASAGGIPVKSLVGGGKIVTVQMEHIWVEAAIDYIPSRGVVNKSADNWVPMDASYKQYQFVQGIDVGSITGLSSQSLKQAYLASGTVNTQESWASGFDASILTNATAQGQSSLQNYISANMPNATVKQIVGGLQILPAPSISLSATLTNTVVVVGTRYGILPTSLEQTMTFALGFDSLGDPNNSITLPWAKINNHEIILSFRPASDADFQAILAAFPSGATQVSQLPTAMPGYLVGVVPELKLDGVVIDSGYELALGQNMTFGFTPNFAGRGSIPNTYDVIAGSYLGVAVVAGNISQRILGEISANAHATQSIIDAQDPSQANLLTRDSILGSVFDAGLLGYYSQYMTLANVFAVHQNTHHYLAGGIGTFGYEPQVNYTFGIPTSIHDGGLIMNVPIINVFGADGGNSQLLPTYALETGMLSSALEAAVPNELFSSGDQSPDALSAATIIQNASQAGQRVYEITPTNSSSTLPNIHLDTLAMQDIQNALAAGKEVITHTDQISINGWKGAGYVIFDPTTGDGQYKITGGANGSFMKLISGIEFASVFVLALVASVVAAGLFAGPLAWLIIGWELLSLTSFVVSFLNGSIQNNRQFQTEVMLDWVSEAVGLIPFEGAGAVATQWFGSIFGWILTNPFGWFY